MVKGMPALSRFMQSLYYFAMDCFLPNTGGYLFTVTPNILPCVLTNSH